MLVLVTGSHKLTGAERDWAERVIETRMRRIDPTEAVFIGGDAWGVDYIGERVAHKNEWFERRIFPAQWKRYGFSAGPRRNGVMMQAMLEMIQQRNESLDEGLVLAFLPKGKWTNGTKDMVKRALRAGVRVEVWVPHNSPSYVNVLKEIQDTQPELLDASQVMLLPAY